MADIFDENNEIEEFDSWAMDGGAEEDVASAASAADDSLERLLSRAEAPDEADEAEDAPEAEEDEDDAPHAISEEMKAQSMLVDLPSALGDIVEGNTAGTTVRTAYLGKEMQASFLEYSMSVIVSRALPDVRDGLKPVHRRCPGRAPFCRRARHGHRP